MKFLVLVLILTLSVFAITPSQARMMSSQTDTMQTSEMQASTQISSEKDWEGYSYRDTDNSDKCYIATMATVIDGSSANREMPYIIVSKTPGMEKNVVSINSGVVYKPESKLTLHVKSKWSGRKNFQMFTVDNNAWVEDFSTEEELIKAMYYGRTLIVSGIDVNNQTVKDSYSLMGFAKTRKKMIKTCR